HDIGQFLETYVPEDSIYPGDAEELKTLLTEQPDLSSISQSVIDRINRIPEYEEFMETHDDEIAANQATINGILEANDLDAIVYPTVTRFGVPGGSGYSNVMIASLSGHPSVSVPSGWSQESDYVEGGVMPANAAGLPTTVSFLGAMNSDAKLISLGYAFEQATKYRAAPSRFPELDASAPAVEFAGESAFELVEPSKSPKPGKTANVSLEAQNVAGVYGYVTEITFNPKKVTPVLDEITSGTSGITRARVSGNTLTVMHTKLGSSPEATGDFSLADIPFAAKAGNGLATVAVSSITLVAADGTTSVLDDPQVARVVK
ncbi:cohesin domain-containing protein, partial [Paenibacillus solisilvae]